MRTLYVPHSYQIATRDERLKRCNGCGPKGLGWLVPDKFWGLDVQLACDIHDWMCSESRDDNERRAADEAFLNNLLYLIETRSCCTLLRWLRSYRAMTYYNAVREGGGFIPRGWDDV